MDFIQSEMNKEFSAIGFKNQRRSLKPSGYQIGTTHTKEDKNKKSNYCQANEGVKMGIFITKIERTAAI